MFVREYKLRNCLQVSPDREVTHRKHNLGNVVEVLFPYISAILDKDYIIDRDRDG